MKDVKQLFARPAEFYVRILSLILTVVPVFYIASHMSKLSEYPWSLAFLICGVITDVVLLFLPGKVFSSYLALISAVWKALALSFFLLGGVLSVVDYIYGISLFGDASQFSAIVGYGVVLTCAVGTAIADCFLMKQ